MGNVEIYQFRYVASTIHFEHIIRRYYAFRKYTRVSSVHADDSLLVVNENVKSIIEEVFLFGIRDVCIYNSTNLHYP